MEGEEEQEKRTSRIKVPAQGLPDFHCLPASPLHPQKFYPENHPSLFLSYTEAFITLASKCI